MARLGLVRLWGQKGTLRGPPRGPEGDLKGTVKGTFTFSKGSRDSPSFSDPPRPFQTAKGTKGDLAVLKGDREVLKGDPAVLGGDLGRGGGGAARFGGGLGREPKGGAKGSERGRLRLPRAGTNSPLRSPFGPSFATGMIIRGCWNVPRAPTPPRAASRHATVRFLARASVRRRWGCSCSRGGTTSRTSSTSLVPGTGSWGRTRREG